MSNHHQDQNWDRVSELLLESDCIPEAPDCRSAVMARISKPARGRSLVWACGFAAVLVAVVAVALMLPHSAPRSHEAKMVSKQAPAPRYVVQHAPAQREITEAVPTQREPLVVRVHRSNPVRARIVRVVKPQQPRQQNVAQAQPEILAIHVVPVAAPITVRPIAIAIVTWPSENDSSDRSYSYQTRDTATGQTTECRVKRSGDSVEIYMESKPEADEPPVKGSVEYETNPSV